MYGAIKYSNYCKYCKKHMGYGQAYSTYMFPDEQYIICAKCEDEKEQERIKQQTESLMREN
jgi:hypothetical protein